MVSGATPGRRLAARRALSGKRFCALRGGTERRAPAPRRQFNFACILENMIGKITVPTFIPLYRFSARVLVWIVRGPGDGDRSTSRQTEGALEMRRIIAAFIADQTGATAIEYGLIAAGISIAIIVAVNNLGTTLNGTFTGVNSQLR
jgi:pilus assembly protein Flp/PilA